MQLTAKQARDRMGWSLNVAQEKSGLNKSTISRVERGLVRPGIDTVLALQKAYRLKAGELVFPLASEAA